MFTHLPVLLEEILAGFNIKPGSVVIDGTLGLGGHAAALLKVVGEKGFLIGIDRDPNALTLARQNLKTWERQTRFYHNRYDEMESCWRSSGLPEADAVLLDLGVSSMQLDDASRGFSFLQDAPLDMRMNPNDDATAADVVNTYAEADLSELIFRYGEEPKSRQISRGIVQYRQKKQIETTKELADLVCRYKHQQKWTRLHPATKTFQALRIEVNQELKILTQFLQQDLDFIKMGGRLAVISFHSLEDRLVKVFGKQREDFKILCKKPIIATENEMQSNPRSRSAKLRIFEKTKKVK